jgi:hypothetical protein
VITILQCLLVAAAVAAILAAYSEVLLRRALERDLREQLAKTENWLDMAHARERAATERLVQAWRDGYTVPAPEADDTDDDDLPEWSPAIAEFLDQWEDLETRARWEAFIRTRLNRGRSEDAALADAELAIIEGQGRLLTPQLHPDR